MKKKNKTAQLIVILILIFSLMLLSVCFSIYMASDSETENAEFFSAAEEETISTELTQVSEMQTNEENESTEELIQLSEKEDTQAYFTASGITPEIYERINGCSYVENEDIALEDLRYLKILHIGFDGEEHDGELIVNQAIADDILEIMQELYQNQYPIERMVLVDEYGGDDELSMQANNTSCFNYRNVEGSDSLSKHSYGLAIDINPFYNPCVRSYADGSTKSFPEGSDEYADRSKDFPYKIDKDDLCYQLFTEHGFRWGGTWNSLKDYQHFDKQIR